MSMNGVIIVFAKCPIPGASKTRLSGMLGVDGSAKMAKAMLSDVLLSLSHDGRLSSTKKVLVYAPGNQDGQERMNTILNELGLGMEWILLPMLSSSSSSSKSNLKSSDLGTKLADALNRVRELMEMGHGSSNNDENDHEIEPSSKQSLLCQTPTTTGPVVFLGMDSPELPIDEILYAMEIASASSSDNSNTNSNGKAYLNPACDGGYGMLCVPPHAPTSIFHGIRWSNPLTAVSQLKALSDHGIDTVIGSLMDDIDEPDDCINLVKRLCEAHSHKHGARESDGKDLRSTSGDILLNRSALHLESSDEAVSDQDNAKKGSCLCPCPKTFETLQELGLINKAKVGVDTSDEKSYFTYKPNLDNLTMKSRP